MSVILLIAAELLVATISEPLWLVILTPLPATLMAADSLSPVPFGVRHCWRIRARVYRAVAAGLITLALAIGISAVSAAPPNTDQPLAMTCAARDLIQGHDPYKTYEPQCVQRLHYHGTSVTPIMAGPFAASHHYPSNSAIAASLRGDGATGAHAGFPAFGYPPEAALLLVPVAFAGWPTIDLWVALLCLILLYAIWSGPVPARMSMLAWQLGALAVLWWAFGWNPEDVSYLILAVAFARIDRVYTSAVAMAAAILTNPIAWLAAPIFVAVTHHEPRWTTRLGWLGVSLLAGLLPWYLWDHSLPAELWGFVTMPTFPVGAALGRFAAIPGASRIPYTAAFLTAIAACTLLAWRSSAWRWSAACLVWAAFLVSWRAPLYYYFPALWLSPAVVIGAFRLHTAKWRRAQEG